MGARARAAAKPLPRGSATTTASTGWQARHSVRAYRPIVGPLWKIAEADAKNLAADFYEALLLRRTSIGEALAVARRRRKQEGSAGWTGVVLYGDPTPTVLQRLSPAEPDAPSEQGQRDGNGLEFGGRGAESGIRLLGDVEAT
jgi:hypothetical protein